MKALEVSTVGQRNARPGTVIPVPVGMDAQVFLSVFIDEKMQDGYTVVGSYGNQNTVGMCKRGGALEPPVLRVKIVEIAEVEAKAS